MFTNFQIQRGGEKVAGYHWPCVAPKKVLCIIHGIGEHGGRYDRMATFLNENNIAVIAFDHRGHGISPGVRGHCFPRKDVLGDVDALLEYAEDKYPQAPIVLYGHSMGGNICLDYRHRGKYNDMPEKYIVSAPWIKLVRPVPKILYKAVKFMSKIKPEKTMNSACKKEDLGNLSLVDDYDSDPLVHTKISLGCAVDGFEVGTAIYNGNLENNHRADRIPLLLMHGDSDKICSVEGSRQFAQINAENPFVKYIEWKGYRHEIHNGGEIETGERVLETIRDYILEKADV